MNEWRWPAQISTKPTVLFVNFPPGDSKAMLLKGRDSEETCDGVRWCQGAAGQGTRLLEGLRGFIAERD